MLSIGRAGTLLQGLAGRPPARVRPLAAAREQAPSARCPRNRAGPLRRLDGAGSTTFGGARPSRPRAPRHAVPASTAPCPAAWAPRQRAAVARDPSILVPPAAIHTAPSESVIQATPLASSRRSALQGRRASRSNLRDPPGRLPVPDGFVGRVWNGCDWCDGCGGWSVCTSAGCAPVAPTAAPTGSGAVRAVADARSASSRVVDSSDPPAPGLAAITTAQPGQQHQQHSREQPRVVHGQQPDHEGRGNDPGPEADPQVPAGIAHQPGRLPGLPPQRPSAAGPAEQPGRDRDDGRDDDQRPDLVPHPHQQLLRERLGDLRLQRRLTDTSQDLPTANPMTSTNNDIRPPRSRPGPAR